MTKASSGTIHRVHSKPTSSVKLGLIDNNEILKLFNCLFYVTRFLQGFGSNLARQILDLL